MTKSSIIKTIDTSNAILFGTYLLCCLIFQMEISRTLQAIVTCLCLTVYVAIRIYYYFNKPTPSPDKNYPGTIKYLVYKWGYIIHYLFFGSCASLLVIYILKKDLFTSGLFFAFFFIAGIYAGTRISFYCFQYRNNEARKKYEEEKN